MKNAAAELLMHRKFVLAGGLNESNVQEGMKLFSPDVVDVSSGVEVENGKDKTVINWGKCIKTTGIRVALAEKTAVKIDKNITG